MSYHDPIVNLTHNLIKCRSLTPNEAGCNKIIINYLLNIGFKIEIMQFGTTQNIWAYRGSGYTLLFLGHTDVVHVGNLKYWKYPPFEPTLNNGFLYGRGASDMKGALSAMLVATKKFFSVHKNFNQGRLAFLISSDEEGSGQNGTKKVVEILMQRKEKIDCCLIGEPTGERSVGDIIKNGRRGSLDIYITIYGKQEHIAYANFRKNPIYLINLIISRLTQISWDNNKCNLPKTSMQFLKILSDFKSSNNVTPSQVLLKLNFRFNLQSNKVIIQKKIEDILKIFNCTYKIKCNVNSNPFITKKGSLFQIVKNSVKKYQNIIPSIKNSGGTSDGRFIYKISKQIIELGLLNNTIHQENECVKIRDLQILCCIYQEILSKIYFDQN
ncbi:N-succinyl-diaminopimelate deacylase [Wigglesworthia glossinidia endosymbiont of Glossina morsitans morsitans (Yale colony)]|uniref:Succinyl-diaminopimelate desuccinylase n=1 Tax=Wigglesworthia glossinidia endosymbiont of Glossina morsitans morsitans (Yale colony) TaxID=1142511 RepID=H6Q535_WIGGL|nr:succinyl-diaminopimelate desuccinylase [Wigglesworthia glossinidia]AFA41318.1 N-succinyl-diaminopimelate deacylase [Wigglesworthia glossinidia endosymbiont of Glossina morsitans morsitans (Yale colony)]